MEDINYIPLNDDKNDWESKIKAIKKSSGFEPKNN